MYLHTYIYIYVEETARFRSQGVSGCQAGSALQHNEGTHIYGVATMNRLLKIIGLFCKRAL